MAPRVKIQSNAISPRTTGEPNPAPSEHQSCPRAASALTEPPLHAGAASKGPNTVHNDRKVIQIQIVESFGNQTLRSTTDSHFHRWRLPVEKQPCGELQGDLYAVFPRMAGWVSGGLTGEHAKCFFPGQRPSREVTRERTGVVWRLHLPAATDKRQPTVTVSPGPSLWSANVRAPACGSAKIQSLESPSPVKRPRQTSPSNNRAQSSSPPRASCGIGMRRLQKLAACSRFGRWKRKPAHSRVSDSFNPLRRGTNPPSHVASNSVFAKQGSKGRLAVGAS
jgi:hypothetical protein